jgi:hypothetical protein
LLRLQCEHLTIIKTELLCCPAVGRQGPEVRSGDLAEPLDLVKGQRLTFTIQEGATGEGRQLQEGARG